MEENKNEVMENEKIVEVKNMTKEEKKSFNLEKNLAKTRLNLIISEIKKSNKDLKSGLKFDLKSLKNNLYNMKLTSDKRYIETLLEQPINITSLHEIIEKRISEVRESLSFIFSNINNELDKKLEKEILAKYEISKSYILNLEELNEVKCSTCPCVKAVNDLKKLVVKEKLTDERKAELKNYASTNLEKLETIEIESAYQNLVNKLVELSVESTKKIEKVRKPNKFLDNKIVSKVITFFKKKIFRLKPTIASEDITFVDLFRKENLNKLTIKTYLFGNNEKKGVLSTFLIYALLVIFGFVYLYPLLYMISYSFMSSADLVNPNVTYIPTQLETQNYADSVLVLNYWESLWDSLLVSVLPSICQVVACSLTAWGLARYKFKGSKILFGLVIFTFLIPSSLTMLPTVRFYASLGLTGNVMAYILPALFGQGLKSAVFILIFYQYFKNIPYSIIEASEIDGANAIVVFLKIAIPAAKSGILLTLLLSIVWYYNETVLASVFFGSNIITLPLGLESFKASFDALYQESNTGKSVNEAIYMAGTVLNILPLLILYFFTQKYFIQGVDKAGITGE